MGYRGKNLKPVCKNVKSAIVSPLRGHSEKPPEVRERIKKLYGPLNMVELFARDTCEGFDAIGNGIDGRDIREVLEQWG